MSGSALRDAALSGSALSRAEVAASADWIASVQLPTGMVPWYPGGHADAWNHTEAAMALSLAGRRREAEAAFEWLRATQQADGSWCLYLLAEGVEEPRRDPNVCAYVATGVWWHWGLHGDRGFLETMWPTVSAAVDFALGLEAPGGRIRWCQDVDGYVGRFALLTATSSILRSVRCAVSLAAAVGEERPGWQAAAERIAGAIAGHLPAAGGLAAIGSGGAGGSGAAGGAGASGGAGGVAAVGSGRGGGSGAVGRSGGAGGSAVPAGSVGGGAAGLVGGPAGASGGGRGSGGAAGASGGVGFAPKNRWAMDWYYPVLSGAIDPASARARLEEGWETFVLPGRGVRCVCDHEWVTVAETAECAMALDAVGARRSAIELLGWTRQLRDPDGAYATGSVYPRAVRFPGGERSTYSAAAVLMADHLLFARSAVCDLFRLAGEPASAHAPA